MDPKTAADLKNRFSFHAPKTEGTKQAHEDVRDHCHALAQMLVRLCPPSRELSLALTKVEEAMMWSNAAIARNQP